MLKMSDQPPARYVGMPTRLHRSDTARSRLSGSNGTVSSGAIMPGGTSQESRVRLDADDLRHLAARGEDVGRGRCLAKQHRRLAEPALDGTQPVGKIFGRSPHQEIGTLDGAGEGPSLVRKPELSVDQRLQSKASCCPRPPEWC